MEDPIYYIKIWNDNPIIIFQSSKSTVISLYRKADW